MPRRKDNEIYSYKLKSGNTKFGFKTYIGTSQETGKAVKVTRQGFSTRKEAEQAKIRLKADGAKKIEAKRVFESSKKTVQEVYELWIKVYQTNVRGSTLNRAVSTWDNNIKPEFGQDYINHISIDRLQSFANRMAQTHIKYHTILGLLHRVVKYAIIRGWCAADPFDRIIVPKKTTKASTYPIDNFYDLAELKDFLQRAKDKNHMYYAFFMVLGSLGLRRGEALALQWKNIDFTNKTVAITHTVSRDKSNHKTINPTKTPQSQRVLSLSDNLAAVLKDYKKSQTDFNQPSDYLFHTRNGEFQSPACPSTWINSIYRSNPDIRKITPHGFRHTLATLLYEGNSRITPKDVQMVLGHSKVTTALNIYTHVTENQRENIKNSINNLDL